MKNKRFKSIYIMVLFLIIPVMGAAQDIISGFLLEKGKMDVALTFTHESSTEFFVGTEKMDLPAKYKVQSWTAYLAYGLADNVNIVLNLPYIKATIKDLDLEEKGAQDAGIFLKWRPVYRKSGGGELSIVLGGGITFPMSEYVHDTLVSIGNRATSIDGRVCLLYKFNSGLFTELLGGYSLRSDVVPNAYTAGFKAGFAFSKLYLESWIQIANSTDGTDIGDINFTLPSTKVNYTRAGVTVYYPIVPKVGIFIKWFSTLDGRNIKKANSFSSGLVLRL